MHYTNVLITIAAGLGPTNVFVTFLDASKVFDRINHWLLYDKLLKR